MLIRPAHHHPIVNHQPHLRQRGQVGRGRRFDGDAAGQRDGGVGDQLFARPVGYAASSGVVCQRRCQGRIT